jgi:hypothetical protein
VRWNRLNNGEDAARKSFFGHRNLMNDISSNHYTQLTVSHRQGNARPKATGGSPPLLMRVSGIEAMM